MEAMLIAFLDERMVVPVVGKVPNPRPTRFVRVWRTGGSAVNRVLERPIVTVQAWAEDDATSSAALLECRSFLFDQHTLMPLVRGFEETTGPYFDPDPETGIDRYSMSVQMSVRAAR